MSAPSDRDLSRREFPQIGMLAIVGLTLPELPNTRAASGTSSSATSVSLLYQHGGAFQLETYDLKSAAPEGYRNTFVPISTTVPGMEVCQLFPRQGTLATLIADIHELRLRQKILVVVVREFGHTLRLSHNSSGTWLDH